MKSLFGRATGLRKLRKNWRSIRARNGLFDHCSEGAFQWTHAGRLEQFMSKEMARIAPAIILNEPRYYGKPAGAAT